MKREGVTRGAIWRLAMMPLCHKTAATAGSTATRAIQGSVARRDARGLVIGYGYGYGYAPLAGIMQGAPVLARLIQEEIRRSKADFQGK